MDLEGLQARVANHDVVSWQQGPGLETDVHNLLHLIKTSGAVATCLEAQQDDRTDVPTELNPAHIADLIIEAARFANNHSFSLDEILAARLQELRARAQARNA